MKNILVLGGGISGLTAAWAAQKQGHVTLLEGSSRLGGSIETVQEGSAFVEKGPRTFVSSRSSSLLSLICELGLQDELVAAAPAAKKRYIWHRGRLRTPFSFLPKLIGPLLREPFRPPALLEDESIYDFAARRLSPFIANALFDPMTLGIYAGDIRKLSLRSCFPTLHQWEQESGSLVRAMWRRKKTPSHLFTLRRGMQSLVTALAQKNSAELHLNTPVLALTPEGVVTPGRIWKADQIISALPAPVLGRLTGLWPNFPTASLWVVSLTLPPDTLPHSGFGYLVPTSENEPLLGMVWDSCLFPQPDQKTRLTAMIRAQGNATWAQEVALSALRRHLGLKTPPLACSAHLAQNAIPQFEVGYAKRLAQFRQSLQAAFPNLSLVGNYLEGPSVDTCIKVAKLPPTFL